MRTINITNARNVEVWPGRRLYVPGDSATLVALPKGGMIRSAKSLAFGSATKTTVTVVGTEGMIAALFDGIVDMERPDAAKTITSGPNGTVVQ